MSHNEVLVPFGRPSPLRLIPRAALLVVLAVAAGLLLAQALIRPPAADLWALAAYMVASTVVTLAAGVAALTLLERRGPAGLRAKVAMGGVVGVTVGLLNVLLVARLMFVSTTHDLQLLAALLLVSGVTAVGFSLWVAGSVTRDLDAVTSTIRRLAHGDLEARVDTFGHDEVASLAQDVSALAARLEEANAARDALDRDRRDLTAAISHDLRTPLASIRAMAEALSDGVVQAPEETARYHAAIRREVERLTRLVDDLFRLSQIDTGTLQLTRQPIGLEEVAADVVDAMQAHAATQGIHLDLRAASGLAPALIDGAQMERAVRNLVVNALEHTPAGGRVTVEVSVGAGEVILSVRDTGNGIVPADLPRVWDRFFRGERSRGHHGGSGGVGLGLAIVRGIVEAHGGRVHAASTVDTGSTFTVAVPRADDAI